MSPGWCRCCAVAVPSCQEVLGAGAACPAALVCNGSVDRRSPAGECGQNLVVEPGPQDCSPSGVPTCRHQRACLAISSIVMTEWEEVVRLDRVGPRCHLRVYPLSPPQLGQDVGVEQEHQARSGARNKPVPRRGGSNSISSVPGWSSNCRMHPPWTIARPDPEAVTRWCGARNSRPDPHPAPARARPSKPDPEAACKPPAGSPSGPVP